MIEYTELGSDVLPPDEMLQTLRLGIWNEIYEENGGIDVYRRTLQREYLSRFDSFLNMDQMGGSRNPVDLKNSDIRPLIRTELGFLEQDIKQYLDSKIENDIQKAHLEDAIIRIEQLLKDTQE